VGQFCQDGGEGVIDVIAGEQFFTQRELLPLDG
jgi:hypothetical protein